LVNVSLALINLLPLPVLDGGHIALAMVEKLRGRPLSRRFKEYITGLFALLLICFMLYVSYNDIVQRFPLLKTMLQQKVKIETNPQKTTGSPLEK
jgi:regulator of sigma E protease